MERVKKSPECCMNSFCAFYIFEGDSTWNRPQAVAKATKVSLRHWFEK